VEDPLVALSMALHNGRGHYAVLVGSGISRSSGIPTGWEIVLDLVRQFAATKGADPGDDPAAWYEARTGQKPDYSKLLNALGRSKTERALMLRSYFEPTVEERQLGLKVPTRAHRALASMAARGVLRVFLTTNFDRLLEKAFDEEGIVPTVISTPDALEGSLPLAHAGPIIVKLHGDYRDTRIKNTPEELQEYHPSIDRLLDRIIDDYGLIVCGWSAQWDKALVGAIGRCETHRYNTFWADLRPLAGAAATLLEARDGDFVQIDCADQFFTTIARKVAVLDERVEVRAGEHKRRLSQETEAVVPDPQTRRPGNTKGRWLLPTVATGVALGAIALALWMRPGGSSPAPSDAAPPIPVIIDAGFQLPECSRTHADPVAVKLVDAGISDYSTYKQASLDKAREKFAKAMALEPNYTIGQAWFAFMMWMDWDRQWLAANHRTYEEARTLTYDAVMKCPHESEVRRRYAWLLLYDSEHDKALSEVDLAITLLPNNAHAYAYRAQIHNFRGFPEQALRDIAEARRILRSAPPVYYDFFEGHAHYLLGDIASARAALEPATKNGEWFAPAHRLMAIVYTKLNRPGDANAAMDAVRRISKNACVGTWKQRFPYADEATRNEYLADLRRAGLPDC
jgi:tetratricopeptide (TPR) repeat protein